MLNLEYAQLFDIHIIIDEENLNGFRIKPVSTVLLKPGN
jgi:hypothetical protein